MGLSQLFGAFFCGLCLGLSAVIGGDFGFFIGSLGLIGFIVLLLFVAYELNYIK